LKAIWKLVAAGNLAVDRHAPWALAKDPEKAAELDAVLSELVALLGKLTVLVHPFMPERSVAMAQALGLDDDPTVWSIDDLHDASRAPRQVHKSEPLFPRLDIEEVIEGDA